MPCEDGRKYLLGDYARGVLAEAEAVPVREHLKNCPDCRQDLAQFEQLLPLLAHFAEEHIPADSLIDYYHRSQGGPVWSGDGFWNAEIVEKHLSVCDQCQALFDKLSLAEKEFAEVSKEIVTEPTIEKAFLKRRVSLRSRRVWYAAVAAVALLLFLIPNLPLRSQGPMIAVLPFEYTGPPEKEYYAFGITEEITSRLGKVSALGVIAPTSTMQYKNTTKKPGQIGEELGALYLLTGSIRWDTTGKIAKLRVLPRLVRTRDQKELWTEPFEIIREELCNLTEIIARKVIAALNVEFLERERWAMEACPTGNIEAYEYYLRGLEYAKRFEKAGMAIEMYEKAVQLDPNFALAYAQLSFIHTTAYLFWDPTEERLSKIKETTDRALELQPDLPEAHLSMAWYITVAELDVERALKECALAAKELPNNVDVLFTTGIMQRCAGRNEAAANYLKKATRLDPLSLNASTALAITYLLLRNYAKAEREFERGISVAPDWANNYVAEAYFLCLYGEGDIEKARKVLEKAAGKVDSFRLATIWAVVDLFDGNYQKALARLSSASSFNWIIRGRTATNYFLMKAELYGLMNQREMARIYYDSARVVLEPQAIGHERPRDAFVHQDLGVAYAGLGRKEDAIREGKKALELQPVSKDAFRGPIFVEGLAEIYVMVGEYDLAIDQLEYLLSIPSYISVPYLRIDPTWAPLRSHPRFLKLINERA